MVGEIAPVLAKRRLVLVTLRGHAESAEVRKACSPLGRGGLVESDGRTYEHERRYFSGPPKGLISKV